MHFGTTDLNNGSSTSSSTVDGLFTEKSGYTLHGVKGKAIVKKIYFH